MNAIWVEEHGKLLAFHNGFSEWMFGPEPSLGGWADSLHYLVATWNICAAVANQTMYVRKDAIEAGDKSVKILSGYRDQSVVNNLQQINVAGWSGNPTVAGVDDYSELGGPYEDLGIDFRNGKSITVFQDKRFNNCLHRDNVCAPKLMRFMYNQTDLIIGCYRRKIPQYLQCPREYDFGPTTN